MALYQFIGRNDEAIFIVDRCDPEKMSVTNAADVVTREVVSCWGNRRIIYRDSMGEWDELQHERGEFRGFAPLSAGDRARFQEWLVPIGEEIR